MVSSYQKSIHIALSPWDLTDGYNKHAGAAILSVLKHVSSPVIIHLLYDEKLSFGKEEEEKYNKLCYEKLADQYNSTIVYHHVELPNWLNNVGALKRFTFGSMLRLYLPELLVNIDKVIYLDCDVIVRTDLVHLWDMPIDGKYLAAVTDKILLSKAGEKRRDYWIKKGIQPDIYFNSGVIVFNLKEIQSTGNSFTEIVFNYLSENLDLKWPDQDILNWYCQGNYLQLDSKYNLYSNFQDEHENIPSDCIIHYAIRELKPWRNYHGKVDDYYWLSLLETPWCDNKINFIHDIINAPSIQKALSISQDSILSYVDGRPRQKIQFAIKLTISLWKSIIIGGLHLVVSKIRA